MITISTRKIPATIALPLPALYRLLTRPTASFLLVYLLLVHRFRCTSVNDTICIIFCQLLSMPAVFFFISVRNMHLLRVSGNNVYPAIPAVPVSPAD